MLVNNQKIPNSLVKELANQGNAELAEKIKIKRLLKALANCKDYNIYDLLRLPKDELLKLHNEIPGPELDRTDKNNLRAKDANVPESFKDLIKID